MNVCYPVFPIICIIQYSQIACVQSDAAAHRPVAQHNPVPARFATRPLGRSPTIHQEEFSVLCYLRKLLSSSSRTDGIRAVEPRDPLDVCLLISFPPRLT